MSEPLILALPSKGRLKEQTEAWLADCGAPLKVLGGARGYSAEIEGFEEVEVRLASAADIAAGLAAGEVHLGVTGEDLLREHGALEAAALRPLLPLGFGRADLVVATPRSWIDVETMADLDDVAQLFLARTGRRLRVATKYAVQTRAFFARHGLADYRIAESGGATEGAPAAGMAEAIVDITTSGATLAANGLKPLADGLILRSEAQLAASLVASWTDAQFDACARLIGVWEARARGRRVACLTWPAAQDTAAEAAIGPFVAGHGDWRSHGALIPRNRLFAAAAALSNAGVGPVAVTRAEQVFEASSPAALELASALGRL
jgi:ATP phosphoribosyltransferase